MFELCKKDGNILINDDEVLKHKSICDFKERRKLKWQQRKKQQRK